MRLIDVLERAPHVQRCFEYQSFESPESAPDVVWSWQKRAETGKAQAGQHGINFGPGKGSLDAELLKSASIQSSPGLPESSPSYLLVTDGHKTFGKRSGIQKASFIVLVKRMDNGVCRVELVHTWRGVSYEALAEVFAECLRLCAENNAQL